MANEGATQAMEASMFGGLGRSNHALFIAGVALFFVTLAGVAEARPKKPGSTLICTCTCASDEKLSGVSRWRSSVSFSEESSISCWNMESEGCAVKDSFGVARPGTLSSCAIDYSKTSIVGPNDSPPDAQGDDAPTNPRNPLTPLPPNLR
jgi:hypothetical protein